MHSQIVKTRYTKLKKQNEMSTITVQNVKESLLAVVRLFWRVSRIGEEVRSNHF